MADTVLSHDEGEEDPGGFAPADPTDGRDTGDWESRYAGTSAVGAIRFEVGYVFVCLFIGIGLSLAVGWQTWVPFLPIPEDAWSALSPFILAFCGGLLGGTLFSMKWLYHSVAKGKWNRDRRLWRVFTPFLAGGASLAVILLCGSGVIPFLGRDVATNSVSALGISIVLGYFSDRAFSSLERWAEENLGVPRGQRSSS